jgi:hypothetical protein
MRPRSIGVLILALGGLIVWAAHFALLYGVQTAFCTVAPAGWSAAGLRIGGLMLTAVAVAALLALAGRLHLRSQRASSRDSIPDAESVRFLRRVSIAGGALAVLAMLWATVPMLLLSACGPAAA